MIENQKGKYFYDGFGRMKKIETREGKEQKNYYDAEGLRYQIEENGSQIEYVCISWTGSHLRKKRRRTHMLYKKRGIIRVRKGRRVLSL